MNDYKTILHPEGLYHIYNRTNGYEKMFLHGDNYHFFLEKYKKYIYPIAETFCYCLLPNHFHFLVRFKNEEAVIDHLINKKSGSGNKQDLSGFKNLTGLERQQRLSHHFSLQFSHLFNAYTKAFNKQQQRHGSLFQRQFNRKHITDDDYLRKVIHYIHYNPVEAGLCSHPRHWQYSSYNAIISSGKSLVAKSQVLACFDDLKNFTYCHEEPPFVSGID